MGIILLYNPKLKIVDVLNVTGQDITADYKLPYGTTILGNFKSDSQVNDDNIIKANNGNIELLRSMLIVNDILNNNNSLNGYQIGMFKLLYHTGQRSFHQNIEKLKYSFNALLTEVNKLNKASGKPTIKNNFNEITFEKYEDRIARIFESIINKNPNVIWGAEKHLEAFQESQTKTVKQRLEQLMDELKVNEVNVDVKTRDFKTPIQHLAMVIAEAHMHYSGIDYEYAPGDYKKYGAIGQGLMTSMVNNAVDPFTQKIQREVIEKRDAKLRNELNRFGAEVRIATKPISAKSMALASEWNMYDSMFEEGQNGEKFNENFRVKNPYDSKSKLTSEQREYLKFFLKQMHILLDDGSNGNPDSEIGKAQIAAGTWFDVPLVFGSFMNKVTSSGNIMSGIKEEWNQAVETVTHLDNDMSTRDIEMERSRYENFDLVTNSMKMDPSDRRKILDSKGIQPYSRDLSNILNVLAYKTKMAQLNNEIMPLMRSLLIFNNSFMSINNTGAKNFQEHVVKHLQTQIFGINHINPDNKKVAAAVKASAGVLAKMALGFNLLSVTRENVQGFYNNMLNIASASYSVDAPNVKQLMQAYNIVAKEMAKSQYDIGKLDCLVHMFGSLLGNSVRNHAEEISPVGKGGKIFKGDMWMKLNMFPDRLNRLAPTIAFMIKDGCWDAMVWDRNSQTLKYDWKKDKRYDTYAKYKSNPNSVPNSLKSTFEKQQSQYEFRIQKFREEGYVSEDGSLLKYTDDMPAPYIANELATIRDIINQTHGHMSKDERAPMEQTLWLSMVTMFKSWLKTKVNRYTMTGGYKNQGEVTEDIRYDEFGDRLYCHKITDEYGEITYEWNKNPEGGITKYEFVPSFQQGILQSLKQAYGYYKQYGLKGGYQQASLDPTVKKNLKYLSSDLLTCLILFLFAKFIIDFDELKDEYGYTISEMMKTPFYAPMDNNPIQLVNVVLGSTEPPAIAMAGKLLKSITDAATAPDLENLNKVGNNIAAYRIAADLYNSLGQEN